MKNEIELKKIANLLQDPVVDRVLVACHRSPDGDACGSAHALGHALRKMGKQVAIFCPDPFGERFSYLVEKEAFEADFEPSFFITVDIASPEMLCGADFADRIDLALDHHRINTVSAKHHYVDADSASCGEIILDLIGYLPVSPDAYLAEALYTALVSDTGCFRYSNTNENCYRAAALLASFAEEGAFYRINKRLFETKTPKEMMIEGYAAREVGLFADNRVAYLSVSLAEQKRLGASYEELDQVINVIRKLEGVLVSVVLKERESGVFKISVRSEEAFDAAAFCAHFGGGGHRAAAGCTVEGDEKEVLSRVLQEAERRLS
ncbi:MAG: DHH family phosphoesterase [Clostridia bacterium]|nr:DHH family phosphoesterase [Clostridia bacterium]